MIDQQIPATVRRQLLLPCRIFRSERVASGLSGASIFRCVAVNDDQFALRRWPPGTPPKRLGEIQTVVAFAREHGCPIVPRLADPSIPWAAAADSLWELTEWMPGEPVSLEADSEHVRSGAAAIALFHKSVSPMGVFQAPPPAAETRVRRCKELQQSLPAILQSPPFDSGHVGLDGSIDRARELLRTNWSEVNGRITRSLSRYEDVTVPNQYVLRDVHNQHVFFQARTVTGLIDFDAIRVDTPMTDLARWVGSFHGIPEVEAWNAAMAGYQEHSPFSQCDQESVQVELAKEISFATKWISLANWVVWVVGERRSFPGGPDQVANRIGEWVGSCHSRDLGDLR